MADGAEPRILVPAPQWLTAIPATDLDAGVARRRLVERGLRVIAGGAVPISCGRDLACLSMLGRRHHVDKVVVIELASLGTTVVARMRGVDVRRGVEEQSRQRVIEAVSPERFAAALDGLALELAASYRPDDGPTPWYASAWLWVAVTVLVGAAIATTAVLATGGDPQDPDVVIRPP